MFRRRGYTLIELMAVIVIMALAAGFMLPNLAATDDAAHCRLIAAQIRDIDRKARLLARSEGMMVLRFDQEAHSCCVSPLDLEDRLVVVAIPSSVEVKYFVEGSELPLWFDRNGRSPDYGVNVRCGEHQARLRFVGMTGHVTEGKP